MTPGSEHPLPTCSTRDCSMRVLQHIVGPTHPKSITITGLAAMPPAFYRWCRQTCPKGSNR